MVDVYLRYPPVEDAVELDRLNRLNDMAAYLGWESALRETYKDNPGMINYVFNAQRARFIDHLPTLHGKDVLEIGPGLGQFTTILASRARSVTALEVVQGQAEFLERRCQQTGLTNVKVAAGGDDCRLPYPDSSFDLVVLNLVLEWCASRCGDEDELEVQRRLLSEICRVLRPGGSAYISTKNRYALRYLLGGPDEHSHGMPFGNALPRWIWRLLLGGKRPGGLLHSYAALNEMLREAGFSGSRSLWAAPELRFPTHYIATDASSVKAARRDPSFKQGDSRSTRMLMRLIPASLVRQFTPGLTVVATR